ncbi:hypothetical protein FHU35_121 [Saccharopolyspora dendranthemae]|uniref:Uncharacterized protein n=1 Tax=Saccharopolyspora dendranthemae TaxID=1181886 RepID=A0A561U6K7_9PSEU|nr:hypothetical protein FHU35_121 [Saccharopolyspora dendranthemae]
MEGAGGVGLALAAGPRAPGRGRTRPARGRSGARRGGQGRGRRPGAGDAGLRRPADRAARRRVPAGAVARRARTRVQRGAQRGLRPAADETPHGVGEITRHRAQDRRAARRHRAPPAGVRQHRAGARDPAGRPARRRRDAALGALLGRRGVGRGPRRRRRRSPRLAERSGPRRRALLRSRGDVRAGRRSSGRGAGAHRRAPAHAAPVRQAAGGLPGRRAADRRRLRRQPDPAPGGAVGVLAFGHRARRG